MKNVKFDLPIFNPLNQGPLRISQHALPVELELTAGEHLFTSDSVEIGTFFHNKVFAHISIPYSYDPDMQYVTISGPEDSGYRQIAIHTNLDQNPKINNSHILNSSGAVFVAPNLWKDYTDNTPVVMQVIQIAIRHAIDALIKHLLDAGLQGVIQTGCAPIVTPHNYQDYKAMFTPNKTDVEQPTLDDILEVQTVINSTYFGTITWTLDYKFANITGSTHDPKPATSWIQLWADKCHGGHDTTCCSSFNYSDGKTPFGCNTSDFVGGHVIPGIKAAPVATGGTAYIFPICKAHNGNDNVYMSSRYNPEGVILHNYNK